MYKREYTGFNFPLSSVDVDVTLLASLLRNTMARRPEHALPAGELYNDNTAYRYARSSRLSDVQTELASRCIELLALPQTPSLLLDIGCGTGFSTSVAHDAGHIIIGTDLSRSMLEEASEDVESNVDLLTSDAGEGVPFRTGTFDGAISVSAIQWLCTAANSGQNPHRRLREFFETLYASLRTRARAALQFYPENVQQMELITSAAARAGFSGGLLIDYPNSARAKKHYLVITAGPPNPSIAAPVPRGTDDRVMMGGRRKLKQAGPSRRDAVISKKHRRRRQGHETKNDSKYTGRKRRIKF